jgi:hypothetical protein
MAVTEEERRLEFLREMKRLEQLRQMKAQTHGPAFEKPEESEEFKLGRQMPTWAQTALQGAQALSFGMIPKLTGPKTGEMVRGATTQFREDYPKSAFGIDVAGSMAPGLIAGTPTVSAARTMAAGGTPRIPMGTTQELTVPQRIGIAAGTGGIEGGLQGYGYSDATTSPELMKDILQGAGFGVLGGGGTTAATSVMGPIARVAGEKVFPSVSASEAQKRLAQALMRDTPESYGTDFAAYVKAQMGDLGPEGRLYDVGENARKLADLLSTIPGRARGELIADVGERRLKRGERMAASAAEGLQFGGKRLAATVDDLQTQRSTNAAPLYTQAYKLKIADPSGSIARIVEQADRLGATKVAQQIADNESITKGLPGWSLTPERVSSLEFNVSDLDRIKQGLDTLIAKNYDAAQGKYTTLGQSLIGLRDKLRDDLVRLTTDPKSKESVYEKALNEYAGPSAMLDAAAIGKGAIAKNVSDDYLRQTLGRMTDSEKDAFRIGLYEAIREKVGGSAAGRTEMMNLVENFVPREKLAVAFGSADGFKKFFDTMNAERIMREADTFGRGSQTTPRLMEAGEFDLEPVLDIAGAATNPAAIVPTMVRRFNQMRTPEATRNELARLLMQRGPQAEKSVFELENIVRKLNEQRARRAAAFGGAGGGVASSQMQTK